MRVKGRLLTLSAIAAAVPMVALASPPAAVSATTFVNWPAYLQGPAHSSYNAQATAFTPADSGALTHDWTWAPPAPTQTGQPSGLEASPTVVNGVVYIGANTGIFYALKESTGKVLWHQNLGYQPNLGCGALGIISTAAVQPAPGGGPLTVYVAGGDGYLYALDAATGAVDWKSVIAIPSTTANNYFDWSSPTVANGHIYVGVSSNCDDPLVAGGLKEFNQATGALQNFYHTYPGHSVQPSIWSSAAVNQAAATVFVTTGNGPGGDSVSIVRLDGSTLARLDAWQIPSGQHGSDSDFGGSPTLFTATIGGVATPMVGACNKNGVYYAWRQNDLAAGPVWTDAIGAQYTTGPQCDAAGIWDGSHLFIAGNQTTINGVTYAGSIRMVNPATGAYLWQRGLIGPPIGSPTMDRGGVIGVTEYGYGTTAKAYNLYLIDAATGAILNTINIGPDFGQPVFADDKVFIPTQNRGMIVDSPSTAPPAASFTYGCTKLTCTFDGSGSTGGVTAYAWDFGDGTTGSGATISHTFATAGTYNVTLTVTGQGGLTDSQTRQVTVPPAAQPIGFVAAANAFGNNPTESLTVPSSVAPGNGLVLIATGSGTAPITAPAGWTLLGTESGNGVMVTSIWTRVAAAGDPGSKVTLTFSTTYRHGDVELLAYSGTSTASPVSAFATHWDHVSTATATTPTLSVSASGSWVVSGWQTKSSTVTAWTTTPSGQLVRDEVRGSGTGRLDMLATDYGAPVPAGTAGGLSASTDQAFSADTTLTLVLAPAS
ncbi:MAG: outer membrane protein assembly factor BamB family protein [Streptosporangiaceae bacterium]